MYFTIAYLHTGSVGRYLDAIQRKAPGFSSIHYLYLRFATEVLFKRWQNNTVARRGRRVGTEETLVMNRFPT